MKFVIFLEKERKLKEKKKEKEKKERKGEGRYVRTNYRHKTY